MSEDWKAYWPIFEQLEEELCELSFSIAFSDTHLCVYSARLADLLLRSCEECENVGKALCNEKDLVASGTDVAHFNFPQIGMAICSHICIHGKELVIIWPYQTLTRTTIKPFDSWRRRNNPNPAWFDAYNGVKHDRITRATDAKLDHVINALGGLFILNLWLREEDITKDSDDVTIAKRLVISYSRFFSPARFLQPASANGMSVSGGVSTRLRNLEFQWT
jgi:hypothetical protein